MPTSCGQIVLHLAYTVPWAGHLHHQKTHFQLGKQFYWPTIFNDLKNICTTCSKCQHRSLDKIKQAALQRLPIISIPYQRRAMDVVGPLEKSRSGDKYILVICDYATHFSEAFLLHSIKTPKVTYAFVHLFSYVGMPEKILKDQGIRFTSTLMKQLQK